MDGEPPLVHGDVMQSRLRPAFGLLGALLITAGTELPGADTSDWPNWRGPSGIGSTTGKAPERWSADSVAWRADLPGKGTSTPIVWNDRIYLTSPAEGQDAVLAYDLAGKPAWETRLGAESEPRHRTLASSCNPSPVTDGESLFVRFRSGRLAALGFDGKVRWQVDLTERYGEEKLFWDSGTSPALTDRLVIVSRLHGGESWVAAFDKKTGELRWKTDRTHKAPSENDNGYATPVVVTRDGRTEVLTWGADRLTAHDAADGRLVWSAGGFNPDGMAYWPAIATPVVVGDMVVVPVGRDDRPRQARMHGIRLGGSGDVTATHRVWQRDDLGVFVASPVAAGGRVYLLRHRGEVVCVDPATGRTLWTGEFPRTASPYYASPVVANGVLYAAREDGTVFAARVTDGFELLSENPMGERIIATPVPAAGRLILRGDKGLYCVGAR